MAFIGISIQGNIISSEIIEKIREEDQKLFQKPSDFGLARNVTVRDEINTVWSSVKSYWEAFRIRRDRIKEGDSGITETRQGWMMPFFLEMGYDLDYQRKAEIINEKLYPISHKTLNRGDFPVHIAGINQSLDKRSDSGGMRLSPHALVQEYVNNHEHLYAIVTNGRSLRLLRDATRLSRLSFLEFDLERIMEDNLFNEFALLYRLLHVTRMPESQDKGEEAIIEKYHQESLASGSRIREKLSEAVEQAMTSLANGFLIHRDNERLRNAVLNNNLESSDLYLYLLRMVYRMLFLMVIEERNLIFPDKRDPATDRFRTLYYKHFSLKRLRALSMVSLYVDSSQSDLWEGLKSTFRMFEDETIGDKMGIKSLGSGLFDPDALGDLARVKLDNDNFLKVLKILTTFKNDNGQMVTVNYGDLDVEEFGSVYEGLLEYDALISIVNGQPVFSFVKGTGRSSSGSHYTPEELVKPLIKHSLDYLIEDCINKPEERFKVSSPAFGEVSRLGRDGGVNKKQLQERALLSLKVADVACGSGHILLSAARRIALELARVRTGEDQPSPLSNRMALRDVIKNCIYGVDKNPLAVELCKVALWLESHSPGEPLGFLDHHIKCGDSIVGMAHREELEQGIPDEAFKTLPGDEKEVASALLKKNKSERKLRDREDSGVQLTMTASMEITVQEAMAVYRTLSQLPERTPEEIRTKEKSYRKFLDSKGYTWLKAMADTQVAQFFIPKTQANKPYLITDADFRTILRGYAGWQNQQTAMAKSVAQEKRLFHWFLEFPEVFAASKHSERGEGSQKCGFDCILGNPPFLGDRRLKEAFGEAFLEWIRFYFTEGATVDLVVYFFLRINSLLNSKGFQSLISTNTVAQGKARELGLERILAKGSSINFVNQNIRWPGKASVEVSLVSIYKKSFKGFKLLNGHKTEFISSFFDDQHSNDIPYKLSSNLDKSFQGSLVLGTGFILDYKEANKLLDLNKSYDKVIKKYLNGDPLLSNPKQVPDRYVIDFKNMPLKRPTTDLWESLNIDEKEYYLKNGIFSEPSYNGDVAYDFPDCIKIIEDRVKPERTRLKKDANGNEISNEYQLRYPLPIRWWRFCETRPKLYNRIRDEKKVLLSCRVSYYVNSIFISNEYVYDVTTNIVTRYTYHEFAFLQSSLHEYWAWKYGSTMRFAIRYTNGDCIDTFPILENLNKENEQQLETIGKAYHDHRGQLMLLIQLGLTKTYNAFHSPAIKPHITTLILQGKDNKTIEKHYGKDIWNLWNHLQKTAGTCSIEEAIAGIIRLRELHVEMDNAVLEAYGWDTDSENGPAIQLRHDFYEVDYLPENDRIRFTIHPDARREVLKRLLELNHKIHEEEVKAGLWDKNKTKDKKIIDKRLSPDDTEDEEILYEKESEEEQLLEAAEESKSLAFEPGTLFHSSATKGLIATSNCRVIVRNKQGKIFKYHISPKAEKDHYTGEYRQIKPTSPMAEQMIGKSEGDGFEFGGMEYKFIMIEI